MSIDVSQFHQVFFEESVEGLDVMEAGLLSLKEGAPDIDTINIIFRATHSIKGGAGTFGFSVISALTHSLETLLDEMRNGQRDITSVAVNVMLAAVDVIREALNAIQQQTKPNSNRISDVNTQLDAILASDVELDVNISDTQSTLRGWLIQFKPHAHLLQNGNDPIRLLNDLAQLGEMTLTVDDNALPAFTELEANQCYLGWTIQLHGDISRAAVNEIFEWVQYDCDLSIEAIQLGVSTPSQSNSEIESVDVDNISQPALNTAVVRNVDADTVRTSFRVDTEKVDALINLVGEQVITQSMLNQLGENFEPSRLPQLIGGLEALERNTRQLQQGIMQLRMLPISVAFSGLPRLVHDLSAKMGKQVELKLTGERTELDKTVMEKMAAPLVHLVRNCLDHGLETPERREAAGKPATGLVHLNAYHQGGQAVIEISDDGAGLDEDNISQKALQRGLVQENQQLTSKAIQDLIFLPGFSTAEIVSDVSGRGVGMDVVRRNINSLGGSVELKSEDGRGVTVTIRLPLSLAMIDGQIIQLGDQQYIIPLMSIIETVEIQPEAVKNVPGKGDVYAFGDDALPLIRLADIFKVKASAETLNQGVLVIVEADEHKLGLCVDDLLRQQPVVMKSLETNYRKVMGVAGATILDDGAVALIVDIAELHALHQDPSLASFKQNTQAA